LKRLFIFSLIIFSFAYKAYSQIPVTINKKSIDSIYYRNNTKWITLTPFFLVKQEFSTDQGTNWEKVGMLGGNLKPYLVSDSIATQNINLYKYTRLAGIVQMWVIAPLLAYKHYTYDGSSESSGVSSIDNSLDNEDQGGYLTASIIIFCTGTLTYHVLSKTFLYRSLHDYNQGILKNTYFENTSFKFDIKLDQRTQIPQLSLVVSF
jgi:hypothetical protein